MQNNSKTSEKVLLLLSGGKDSRKALRQLIKSGYEVHTLCIDGIQGKEKLGAQAAAAAFGIPLHIVPMANFDEDTWNPLKLLRRDIAMARVAWRLSKRIGATKIATGVKRSDVVKPLLFWLAPFLGLCCLWFRVIGIRALFPVWESNSHPSEVWRRNLRKKIKHLALRILPKNFRKELFFRNLKYNEGNSAISVELAKSLDDYEQAFELVWSAYHSEDFVDDPEQVDRKKTALLFKQLLPSTTIVIAKDKNKVVGTMSIYRDCPAGLPSQKVFPLDSLKDYYGIIIEVGSLAVDPAYSRKKGSGVLFDLFAYSLHYGRKFLHSTAVVLTVYPWHAEFYKLLVGCEYLEGSGKEIYFGKSAVVMHLDPQARHNYYESQLRTWPHLQEFYSQLLGKMPARFKFPTLGSPLICDGKRTSHVALSILQKYPELLRELTREESSAFVNYYAGIPALEEFTNERKRAINMTRTDQRFDVSLKGTFQMKELSYPVNVIDISSGGARIYFNTRFEYIYTKSVSLSFTAEKNGPLTFEFFPVWMHGRRMGLQLKEKHEQWAQLIKDTCAS